MSQVFQGMRLIAQGTGVELLTDASPELLGQVLQHAPVANGLVDRTSQGLRRRLAALVPLPPMWFHVLSNQYPAATEAQSCVSMLAALEAQARRFRLLSIEMPGFTLDIPDRALAHPPFLPSERGAVRLTEVLRTRCAAMECLDLTHTDIELWGEIGAALPSCVALQRVKLTGCVFSEINNPFDGLTQCGALRELVMEETQLIFACAQLAPVLVACRAITKLNLASNNLNYIAHNAAPNVLVL